MYTPISSHTHGSWSTDDRTLTPSSPFCFDRNDSLPCCTLLPYIIPISLEKDSLPYLHSDRWGMGFGVAQWSSRSNQDFLGHWPWDIWGTCSDMYSLNMALPDHVMGFQSSNSSRSSCTPVWWAWVHITLQRDSSTHPQQLPGVKWSNWLCNVDRKSTRLNSSHRR